MSQKVVRNDLELAIEALYEKAPSAHGMKDSPAGPEGFTRRLTIPREELSTNDVRKLISHHHLELDALRYYLPRAFEQMAFGDADDRLEAMVVSSRMRPFFSRFPAPEQQQIKKIVFALWAYRAACGDSDLTELLDFMGWLIDDVTPFLEVFKRDEEQRLCRSLARVLHWQADELARPHQAPCHLPDREREKLTKWLDEVGVSNVQNAFFESEDNVCADIMAEAVSNWSHVRGKVD